jgi:hypothetical protein
MGVGRAAAWLTTWQGLQVPLHALLCIQCVLSTVSFTHVVLVMLCALQA